MSVQFSLNVKTEKHSNYYMTISPITKQIFIKFKTQFFLLNLLNIFWKIVDNYDYNLTQSQIWTVKVSHIYRL